jgi:hypothetical protein
MCSMNISSGNIFAISLHAVFALSHRHWLKFLEKHLYSNIEIQGYVFRIHNYSLSKCEFKILVLLLSPLLILQCLQE